MNTSDAESAGSGWRSLYRIAGVAAMFAVVLFILDMLALPSQGMPTSAADWFALLQSNRAAALVQLYFTDVLVILLLCPIFFALYAALRRVNEAYAAFAAVLAFIGIAIVLAANTNYSLIYLGDEYAAATTDARRAELLAAGEAMTALTNGTGALVMAGLFLEGAFVIVSIIMLRSRAFGRGIGILGIVAHGLDLAHNVVFVIVIPLFGLDQAVAIGSVLLIIGGTLQFIWYPLVGWKLFRMGRLESEMLPQPA